MKPRVQRWLVRAGALAFILTLVVITVVKVVFGGGTRFPYRDAGPALVDARALETVAELPTPPGNIAVSAEGRVFVTLHPEARPAWKLVELVDGEMRPFPSLGFQTGRDEPRAFDNLLSIRIDSQNRLWALDNGGHGLRQGRLLAFSLANGAVVHEYRFPRSLAGLGSHLNDFQISADARHLFIADASIFARTPALLVYDSQRREAWRVLDNHPSVRAERHTPRVQGRRMEIFGLFSVRPGVDSIALSRDGAWLYYGAVTGEQLYRLQVTDLLDRTLSPLALSQRVQPFAAKTVTDGLTSDARGMLYLSDPEYSRVLLLGPDGQLQTLIQSERLRWPDGFSFGPDGDLYIACSALHQVLGRLPWQIRRSGPYPVYRLPLGVEAAAGQ